MAKEAELHTWELLKGPSWMGSMTASRLRVSGGWIYSLQAHSSTSLSTVFVPDSQDREPPSVFDAVFGKR